MTCFLKLPVFEAVQLVVSKSYLNTCRGLGKYNDNKNYDLKNDALCRIRYENFPRQKKEESLVFEKFALPLRQQLRIYELCNPSKPHCEPLRPHSGQLRPHSGPNDGLYRAPCPSQRLPSWLPNIQPFPLSIPVWPPNRPPCPLERPPRLSSRQPYPLDRPPCPLEGPPCLPRPPSVPNIALSPVNIAPFPPNRPWNAQNRPPCPSIKPPCPPERPISTFPLNKPLFPPNCVLCAQKRPSWPPKTPPCQPKSVKKRWIFFLLGFLVGGTAQYLYLHNRRNPLVDLLKLSRESCENVKKFVVKRKKSSPPPSPSQENDCDNKDSTGKGTRTLTIERPAEMNCKDMACNPPLPAKPGSKDSENVSVCSLILMYSEEKDKPPASSDKKFSKSFFETKEVPSYFYLEFQPSKEGEAPFCIKVENPYYEKVKRTPRTVIEIPQCATKPQGSKIGPSPCEKEPPSCGNDPAPCEKDPALCEIELPQCGKEPTPCEKEPLSCGKDPAPCKKEPPLSNVVPSTTQDTTTSSNGKCLKRLWLKENSEKDLILRQEDVSEPSYEEDAIPCKKDPLPCKERDKQPWSSKKDSNLYVTVESPASTVNDVPPCKEELDPCRMDESAPRKNNNPMYSTRKEQCSGLNSPALCSPELKKENIKQDTKKNATDDDWVVINYKGISWKVRYHSTRCE